MVGVCVSSISCRSLLLCLFPCQSLAFVRRRFGNVSVSLSLMLSCLRGSAGRVRSLAPRERLSCVLSLSSLVCVCRRPLPSVCLSFRGYSVVVLHFNGSRNPFSGPPPIERLRVDILSVARNLKGIVVPVRSIGVLIPCPVR